MWVTKLLISPEKKDFLPKNDPIWPQNWLFLSIAGSFGALLVGWLVVVALAVSRNTPIYFILYVCVCLSFLSSFFLCFCDGASL